MTPPNRRTWLGKFRDAFRGIAIGVRGQSSFAIHLLITAAVVIAAAVMQLSAVEWAVLIVCVMVVLAAEMFNSTLECLARAITRETNPHIADALDIAAGAVLITAIGSVIIGAIVFLHRAGVMAGWWG